MTISSTTRTAGPFIGNGTASVFPFAFKVFLSSDLLLVETDMSTGAVTDLVLGSDYSVALNADQNNNPGGSATLLAGALATGHELLITSDLPNLQLTSITNAGGFYPNVINDALDRLTILIQQLASTTIKSLTVVLCPVTTPYTVYTAASGSQVCAVCVNGVLQPIAAYTAVGPVITFTYSLDPGDVVNALCPAY